MSGLLESRISAPMAHKALRYTRTLAVFLATIPLSACGVVEEETAIDTAAETATETATQPLVGAERGYVVHLQALATADDNGSNRSPITSTRLASIISGMNTIYASTGVSFAFDPAADFESKNSTLLNQRFELAPGVDLATYRDPKVKPPTVSDAYADARRDYANAHRGKITVFFALSKELVFDETVGHWVLKNDGGGASSGNGRSVRFSGNAADHDVAHEIGHYLHQTHPFSRVPETVQEAATIIKNYVNSGHSRDEGLEPFDGDSAYVLDTPPDPRGSIIADVHGEVCGPNGTVNVPVAFAPGDTRTYNLSPDRSLVMSYFKGCFNDHFSVDQGTRMRESLELLNRRDLVAVPDSPATLVEKDSATAGAVANYDVAFIGNGRVVTASIDTDKVLKLILWEVNAAGQITRRGSHNVASNVGNVAITDGGLSQVIAFYHAPGYKQQVLRTFRVESDGEFSRLDLATLPVDSAMTGIDIQRFDRLRFMTATESAGQVRLRGWRVVADGTLTPGLETTVGAGSMARLARIGENSGTMLYYKGSDTGMRAQYWGVDDDNKPVQDGSSSAGAINDLDTAGLDVEHSASVVGTGTTPGDVFRQKVILWRRNAVTKELTREGSFTSPDTEPCTKVASAGAGPNYLATACLVEGTGAMRMRLFRVGSGTPALANSFLAGTAETVKLAHVGNDTIVAVTTSATGALSLRSWRIELR